MLFASHNAPYMGGDFIPMQACIMQLLNDSTCRDIDSEYSL